MQKIYKFLTASLLILVLTAHIFQLADVPTGLYLDETSIGYNAALISQSGTDEHGLSYPTYFKAFGEYKNPIYIYATALLFKAFGISVLNLRLTSFVFFVAALGFAVLLISKMFKGREAIKIYVFASFGFLPVLFTLSRVSFEVIAQLTWISAANLLVWMMFHEDDKGGSQNLEALLCGLVLGTSIYTYSTARLLSFLMLISLWAIYFGRRKLRKLILTTSAFSVSLVPYVFFTIKNPGATTTRFRSISYIDDPISIFEKMEIFARNLSKYWSPGFLMFHGDPNLRHSTGYGGIVFSVTVFLFLVGLVNIFYNKKMSRFNGFLLVNLLLSPIAAALTSDGTPHSLRSLLLGYYILILSCHGVELILNIRSCRVRQISIALVSVILAFEIFTYQLNYFLSYSSESVEGMKSFDFETSLQNAIDQNPQKIVFINHPRASYANLRFYSYLVENPKRIPVTMSEQPVPASNSCVLYHRWDEEELDQFSYSFTEYESDQGVSPLKRSLGANPSQSIMKVRCYEDFN